MFQTSTSAVLPTRCSRPTWALTSPGPAHTPPRPQRTPQRNAHDKNIWDYEPYGKYQKNIYFIDVSGWQVIESLCECVYVRTYVRTYVRVRVHVFVCTYVRVCVCVCVQCMRMCTFCVCVCLCVCVCPTCTLGRHEAPHSQVEHRRLLVAQTLLLITLEHRSKVTQV